MRLQAKVGGALLLVFSLLFIAAFGILHAVVTPSFQRLEAENHARSVARVRANIARMQEEMRARTLDYAHWDDTYRYMRSGARSYIDANFSDAWFENYNVDAFLVIDEDGRLLWRGARANHPPLSDQVVAALVRDRRAARATGRQPIVSGFVWTADGPLMYAAAPALRNDGRGQPRGLVVVARRLDRARLQEDIQQSLVLQPASQIPASANVAQLTERGFLAWTDTENVHTLIALRGASGALVGAIRTEEPRAEAALAREAIGTGMLLAAAALLLALAASVFLLTRIVSSRIEALAAHFGAQDDGADLAPLPLQRGADEIAALGNAYNALAIRVREAVEGERKAILEHAAEAQANQMKSSFIANLSHELRTPLNAIIGYAELLEEDAADESAADLRRIQGSARHLLCLINEILDLSRIETGAMPVTPDSFDVARLVADVCDSVRPLAIARGNELSAHCADHIGAAFTDELRLRQALINVLSNACKFTENGRVTIKAQRGAHEGDARLIFDIEDTGIGMTSDHLARIFQPFVQADGTIARRFGGTGLGLALTRKLLGLLGGEITARSTSGEGSTFRIAVPAVLPDSGEAGAQAAA